jgi:hypothetical protein
MFLVYVIVSIILGNILDVILGTTDGVVFFLALSILANVCDE